MADPDDELDARRRAKRISDGTARIEQGLDNLDFARARGLLSIADYDRGFE